VTRETMDEVIRNFRREIPNMVLRTAIIVGFPGETEEEFQDLLDYLHDVRFEKLGTFTFSREEGTRAYGMDGQISEQVKEERYHRVMELQKEISSEWNAGRVGRTLKVLVDEGNNGTQVATGRTEADAPEVDGQVTIYTKRNLVPGDFVDVRITDALEYDLIGEAL